MKPTSVEQSKRLLELGLDPDTADMFYNPLMDIDNGSRANFLETPECMPFKEIKEHRELYMPAWSLEALLGLIPHTGFDGIELNNYNDGKTIWTAIFHWGPEASPLRIGNSPLDAVFEIIVYLLENKYITKV